MTAADSDRLWRDDDRPIRVGVSSCLLGQQVRYDGGHKRDPFLVETFGRFVEWVPVCPEMEAGLGAPREAMRLVRVGAEVRLLTAKTGADVTEPLEKATARRLRALASADLSGYILKKNSPSCGLTRVKVYSGSGMPAAAGRGLFAAALAERFPHLPLEEEGRLSDPRIRENFIERVFGWWRLQGLFGGRWTVADLVRFHTAHKLVLMAHAPSAVRALGTIVAEARSRNRGDTQREYTDGFMRTLAVMATRRRHTNVLQHIAGYFKRSLDDDARRELGEAIEDYRLGLVPLIVPITLIRHHVRTQQVEYLSGQLYLAPHPKELMLRNHT